MTLGEKMKCVRTARGLTQKQVGEKLGVTSQWVCTIEHDEAFPKSMYISAFCYELGISKNKLLEGVKPCG